MQAKRIVSGLLGLRAAGTYAQDALALQALSYLGGEFLPWTVFSMRPAAILAIVTDIEIYGRASIVECGSGNSTVFSARLLRGRGSGHIVSLEHDKGWADLTRRWLARERLDEIVTLIHAPLVAGWYDTSLIPDNGGVDLLVVDGPPATTPATSRSRQPALDWFAGRLTPGASVILDDAARDGEREVLAQWEARHQREFRVERGGYAISAPQTG